MLVDIPLGPSTNLIVWARLLWRNLGSRLDRHELKSHFMNRLRHFAFLRPDLAMISTNPLNLIATSRTYDEMSEPIWKGWKMKKSVQIGLSRYCDRLWPLISLEWRLTFERMPAMAPSLQAQLMHDFIVHCLQMVMCVRGPCTSWRELFGRVEGSCDSALFLSNCATRSRPALSHGYAS
jgi:hypothetical protein